MSFVRIVPPDQATGPMKDQYESMRKFMGVSEYSKLLQCWSLQPAIAAAWFSSQLCAKAHTGLDDVLFELLECRVMYLMKSRYVLVNHAAFLAQISGYSYGQLK